MLPCKTRGGKTYGRRLIERAWDEVADKCPDTRLTWYQATHHSFVSRDLAAGASLDAVSAAVGHSSPVVTRRYYDHFDRRSFSQTLRTGLPLEQGQLVPQGHGTCVAPLGTTVDGDAVLEFDKEALIA